MSKHNLHIDIETYSSIDLKKRGVHNYAKHPDTRLLLFAFALDDEPVQIIDYAQGEYIPSYVIQALHDPTITKHAFNAPFEITVLSRFFDNLPIDQWHCTMFHAQYCGLPASLENVSKILVDQEQQKMTEGKALIRYFSQPCKPTKANGGRRRNLPLHAPEKWHLFKEYCVRDVEAERAIFKKLEAFTPPSQEQADWLLDRQINNRGILIDKGFVEGAIYYKRQLEQALFEQAQQLTGLSNPKSANQLKAWLEKQEGVKIESIAKNNILETEKKLTTSKAKKALRLRNEMTKTSNKKYIVMRSLMACDQRIKESMQFYGANRTGRWAGRGVQVQNLPRTYLENMAEQREAIKNRRANKLDSDTLSQLIRTAFIAPKNQQLVVSDFSAIEARVIAWLSKETWRMNVFATHGKIYEASASQMFGVPIEKITKGNPEYVLRQKGKVAELALGYQGSVNALIAMGALAGGLSEQELPQIVVRWRQASPHIVDLWRTTERSALHAIKNKCATQGARGIKFNFETSKELSFLTVQLPSGRKLFYANAYIAKGRFGNPAIFYQSMDQVTRKWETTQTYGGKLVENIVQAIARDCLMESLRKIATKYKIVMHVHDEVVIEAKKGEQALNDMIAIMSEPIDWAQGLVLRADGFVDDFYRKE